MINQAAELGPATVPWWKDWRAECVAIIACGPSAKKANIAALRDRINVIAIKTSHDLAPWADIVYGCDSAWWRHVQGLPKYKGTKLVFDGSAAAQFPTLHKIDIDRNKDRILVEQAGFVGSGGNSGFQALNLAIQFGCTGIMLIGFDSRSDGNVPHWNGRNEWLGSSNPAEHNYKRWRDAFTASSEDIKALGVDVVNTSGLSAIKCFRTATVEQALIGWGL